MKDKVVVVTGASRGIGRSIALACAAAGADLWLGSRHA
ncbi:MAG: SDR family NAD(P)-dependent oxidoreductase, partial [Burkholderiales bacterium]